MTLKGAGYEVVEAGDGKQALAKLKNTAVHMLITDLNMPNMDGIEFVTQLKKQAAFRFTPVIMLTTEGDDEVKMAGKAAGAKAWIIKPFNPDQMLNAVSKLILP